MDSWIGGDRNQEVRPDELERALGADNVDRMTGDLGNPGQKDGLMGMLASLLPGLVDRLTPGGQMPRTDSEMPQGGLGGILGGLLGQLQGAPGSAASGGGLTDLLGQLLGSGNNRPPR